MSNTLIPDLSELVEAMSMFGVSVEKSKEIVETMANGTDNTYENGFLNGVLFSQRWVPVEDELPNKEGHFLVKCKHSFPKNCDVVIAEFYEDNQTFYSESSDCPIHDATHWRPIERY